MLFCVAELEEPVCLEPLKNGGFLFRFEESTETVSAADVEILPYGLRYNGDLFVDADSAADIKAE